MPQPELIVSDPPHRAPNPETAAQHLDCSLAEARVRLNCPAPEIWLAEADETAARNKGSALLAGGLNVIWIRGSLLAAVPRLEPATAVAIESDGVTITTADGALPVAGVDRAVLVLGEPWTLEDRPRASQERRDSSVKQGGDQQAAEATGMFLDVYAKAGDRWHAARITPGSVDFSGLGSQMQPSARGNIRTVISTLRSRFDVLVDERLVKIAYRDTTASGTPLRHVLGSISEDLAGLGPFEIGSRLAFLTTKAR